MSRAAQRISRKITARPAKRVQPTFTPWRIAVLIVAFPLALAAVTLAICAGPNRWMLSVDWQPAPVVTEHHVQSGGGR